MKVFLLRASLFEVGLVGEGGEEPPEAIGLCIGGDAQNCQLHRQETSVLRASADGALAGRQVVAKATWVQLRVAATIQAEYPQGCLP